MDILFLDTETTDIENARLIQLAYKNALTGETVNDYFKPPVPISYGAMATHHVTNEMVADKPVFQGSSHQATLVEKLSTSILVAHNAPFDIQVLKNEGVGVSTHIDTLRVARHMLTSEQYALQYLRYSLGLNVAGAAHDALGDVLVLEALFDYLQVLIKNTFGLSSDEEVIQKMLEFTQTPALLRSFSFGKYRGKTFVDVSAQDRGYLEWLYGSEAAKSVTDQNGELMHTLKYYLKLL